jgi:hypothetical protein
MATATEARNYIMNNYSVIELSNGYLQTEIEYDNLRSQIVFFSTTDKHGIFISPFAKSIDITAEQVFNYSGISPWGVKLIGSDYCVVHLAPLENLDVNEIEVGFQLVSLVADTIEKEISQHDQF